MKQKSNAPLIVSGALTAVILAVMDIILIPAIQKAAGGLVCFDLQTFGYDYDTARAFMQALSEEGRQLYLYAQLPLDTVFLVVYTVFFILALRRLFASKAAVVLPVLLAAADFAENTCTFLMLRDPGVLTARTAPIFGTITLCKTLLMYAVFAVLLVGLILRFVRAKKQKEGAR